MTRNREILNQRFDDGNILLRRAALFDEAGPGPYTGEFDRVEGMLLGVAIGDSLGKGSEGKLPHVRAQSFGEIRDYLGGRGLPSDDTQLSFWTLEQLLKDGGFVAENLGRAFAEGGRIFGIGGTVKEFLRRWKEFGAERWQECGVHSAGNGALMRIAPVLLPHLKEGTAELWVDAALCAALTHNDSASTAACVAYVRMLRRVLDVNSPPAPEWYFESMVCDLRELENGALYRPRNESFAFEGTLADLLEQHVMPDLRKGLSLAAASSRWYSGAFVFETVPCVLYVLAQHGHDAEEALVRAVNDTKDNDTVAAIVGAAIGAIHGKKGLPERWVRNLTGCVHVDDEGRMFELIRQARKRFHLG